MRALVETTDLCKHYRLGASVVRAIADVSLTIQRHEFVAILGRSGSGKTTLMNLLGLLERPDSGKYALAGQEVASLSERERARNRNHKIGFVFQLPALLPRATALENVALPLAYAGVRRSDRRRLASEALDRVGLIDRLRHCPSQLSGGEQQRVAIARALVNQPTLLLADEPTGALDSATSDEILSLFEELHRQGCTIVVVTHAPDVAERTMRCITLHDGRVTEDRMNAEPVLVLRPAAARR
jgi:putative ABC transport system ATP-binding protein